MEIENQHQQAIKPDSWLVWSILSTILCCPAFGIVGIVFAAQVDSLWRRGEQEEALLMAKRAKTWTIVAICVGLVGGLIYGILIALGVGMGALGEMGNW